MRTWLLWTAAVLLMMGTIVFQRRTGPTHPLRGTFALAGQAYAYRLLRSATTPEPAKVTLPDLGGTPARLQWRRYPTQDPWTSVPFAPEAGEGGWPLAAHLPAQPAAGKVEYVVEVLRPEGALRIPASGTIILRYKNPVPAVLLVAHVAFMFFGVLLGLRAGLAAWAEPRTLSCLAWLTLACLTVGGLVLGPIVQKYAFGAFWTGWPLGGDLTDNKTLLMWGAWAAAVAVIGFRSEGRGARWAAGAAALAMAVVYLVPHSLRGSELDYAKLDAGTRPEQSITTGR